VYVCVPLVQNSAVIISLVLTASPWCSDVSQMFAR